MALAELHPPGVPSSVVLSVPELSPKPAFQTFLVYLPLRNAPSHVAVGIPDEDGFVLCGGGSGDGSCADGGCRGDRGAGDRRGVVRSSWRRFRRFFASASCCA